MNKIELTKEEIDKQVFILGKKIYKSINKEINGYIEYALIGKDKNNPKVSEMMAVILNSLSEANANVIQMLAYACESSLKTFFDKNILLCLYIENLISILSDEKKQQLKEKLN